MDIPSDLHLTIFCALSFVPLRDIYYVSTRLAVLIVDQSYWVLPFLRFSQIVKMHPYSLHMVSNHVVFVVLLHIAITKCSRFRGFEFES